MHKDKTSGAWNGKLVAGPMWDFNLSYGNADYCNANLTTGWQYNFDEVCDFTTAIPFWWEKLLESSTYRNGLRCRWEELRQGPLHTDSVNYFIDSISLYIEEARIRNFTKWPIIGVYVNWNAFVGNTYEEDLTYLKNYIQTRSQWMDANIPGICDLSITENKFVPEYHKIWPNPSDGNAYIGFTLFNPGKVDLTIVDLTGRIVLHEDLGERSIGEHAQKLDLNLLQSGNYVYKLTLQGHGIGTGKLVIR
jgi:hypothetical protein